MDEAGPQADAADNGKPQTLTGAKSRPQPKPKPVRKPPRTKPAAKAPPRLPKRPPRPPAAQSGFAVLDEAPKTPAAPKPPEGSDTPQPGFAVLDEDSQTPAPSEPSSWSETPQPGFAVLDGASEAPVVPEPGESSGKAGSVPPPLPPKRKSAGPKPERRQPEPKQPAPMAMIDFEASRKPESKSAQPETRSSRRSHRRDRKRAKHGKGGQSVPSATWEAARQSPELPPWRSLRSPARRKRGPRGPKLMPADVYRPDKGKTVTVRWLALVLSLAVVFSIYPVVHKMYLNLETAPGWARLVLLLAALQAVYIAWMLNTPDWASVWVVMWVFAAVSAAYGMATAIALATRLYEPLPLLLGMDEEIRRPARAWCSAVMLVMALAAYLCGHTSAKWRRAFELERAGRSGARR